MSVYRTWVSSVFSLCLSRLHDRDNGGRPCSSEDHHRGGKSCSGGRQSPPPVAVRHRRLSRSSANPRRLQRPSYILYAEDGLVTSSHSFVPAFWRGLARARSEQLRHQQSLKSITPRSWPPRVPTRQNMYLLDVRATSRPLATFVTISMTRLLGVRGVPPSPLAQWRPRGWTRAFACIRHRATSLHPLRAGGTSSRSATSAQIWASTRSCSRSGPGGQTHHRPRSAYQACGSGHSAHKLRAH